MILVTKNSLHLIIQEVKQESIFELMYEHTTIFDKEQPSVDKTVQAKHICGLYSCAYCQYNSTLKCLLKIHVHTQHGGVLYSCDRLPK